MTAAASRGRKDAITVSVGPPVFAAFYGCDALVAFVYLLTHV